jgi:hypothetical protein
MQNITNISYLNSLLLANLKSSYLIDSIKLYFTIPMAIIGTLLNLISIIILSTKSFRKMNIYKIMKIYNLTSLLLTFGLSFSFLYTPNVLFELSISLIARIYSCNIVNWIFILIFFYQNCLDILMNLERALSYSNGYQKIKQISPYLICFIVLIICMIIHIPSDLAGTYVPNDELYIKFNLCYPTSFAILPVTKMILIISYIIEGPIVMILVIGSNLLAYISYKSFLKRKQETININGSAELTESEKRKQVKTEKKNKKLLIMTIYLTIFSIISHLIQFGAHLIIFVFSSKITTILYGWIRFAYLFIVIFKNFFTIFFYYHFNSNFKNVLLSFIFKKKTKKTTSTSDRNYYINTVKI